MKGNYCIMKNGKGGSKVDGFFEIFYSNFHVLLNKISDAII